mgnify:CR=1
AEYDFEDLNTLFLTPVGDVGISFVFFLLGDGFFTPSFKTELTTWTSIEKDGELPNFKVGGGLECWNISCGDVHTMAIV